MHVFAEKPGAETAAEARSIADAADAAGVIAMVAYMKRFGTAFARARPGDLVLLAGKGHEPTILYADHALPWDEATVARELLAAMGFGGA